jgi:hypothetical protein
MSHGTPTARRKRRIARYEDILGRTMALLDTPTMLSAKNADRLRLVKDIGIALRENRTDGPRSD